MNIVDYVVLAVIGVSVLFGAYRGFIAAVLGTGGTLISFLASFALYPKLAEVIRGNGELVRTLLHYTDASSRIGDLELAVTNVGQLAADKITEIIQKVSLPAPFDALLRSNLEGRVYGTGAYGTVSDYVSQTILSASINILCFLVCFIALSLVITMVVNILKAVFKFPLLKQLDWLAGAVFGLLRGMAVCYALFALVPLVQSMLPIEAVNDLINQSAFAPVFNNGALILSIMNGRL